MYIRTREEAFCAVVSLLDLSDPGERRLQSGVRILSCLDAEARQILGDCHALLIQGGLDALRDRRREALGALEQAPLIVLDPEGDRLFESAAAALDALSLAGLVREIFPSLRAERWQIARVLLRAEQGLRGILEQGVRARADVDASARLRRDVESLIAARRPAWGDRAGTLRAACLDVLKGAGLAAAESLHEEAERLFQILAVSDERAGAILVSLDGDSADAVRSIVRLHEAVEAVRSLPAAGAASSDPAQAA